MKVKIAAVIVVYEQAILETKSHQSFLKKAAIPFMLYDNSSNEQEVDGLENCTYVHDSTNSGVSKAYNTAIAWAKEINATHLLLLDSDSTFPEQSIEAYREAAEKYQDTVIAPSLFSSGKKISPFFFRHGKSSYGEKIKPGSLKLGKRMLINAGTLLPLSIFDNQLSFHEALKLDWSDIYFFRKLAKRQVKVYHIPLNIEHGLSEHEERPISSAQFRFKTYMKGIPIVADSSLEKVQIYAWSFLKAVKRSGKYKTLWFIKQYFLNLK